MTLGRVAGVSDPGRKRRQNEDTYVCKPPLFAVADGVGGASAGEVASGLAAAALREEPREAPRSPAEHVELLIQEANRRIYQRATEDTSLSGMGTTMTVALVDDGVVTFGHVGDSRAYLFRDGELRQVTDDHSLVAELLRDGKLSREEAETHPQRSVITRAIGTDPDVDVDTFPVDVREGDLFLLSTDGLTDMVDDETIQDIVQQNRDDPERAARALVEAANRGGGEDNITVVFFEITAAAGGAETTVMPVHETDDEEDTLSGIERVPTLEHVGSFDEGGRRPANGRRFLYGLLAVVALAGVCVATLWGLSRSHFVGADSGGQVAVYQGVPYDLVGGVRLYRAVYESPVLAAQLTRGERQRLFDHDLRGHDAAIAVVKAYEEDLIR
ncbi:MAG: Stp1/IreP family PP2C-type Ser/Thr phosphatase [Actinobacteria bacterium]|nr:Stp1/IreP family PP2C-type Ser/Thr phosphatase [Actinomycetota bacterium]